MNENLHNDAKQPLGIRAYGVSASAVKYGIESITGLNPGKIAVYTKETGRVSVSPEIYSTAVCGDCGLSGGGGGNGEGLLCCLLIIAVVMAVFTIVWAVVMIAFSILSVGGFLKKRYRTLFIIENSNREFIGKIALHVFRSGGILEYPFGNVTYDDWMKSTFNLYVRLKIIRQISLLLGFIWGFVEVAFKLNQILFNPADYNAWPLRLVMVVIFLPLLLFSPVLEIQFRQARDTGEEIIMYLLAEEPSFAPDHPMIFQEEPTTVRPILTSTLKTKRTKK
ncbi:MAG: hypothetical protein ACFFDV_12720 [Candidatus Thorarchaeota archaeon]